MLASPFGFSMFFQIVYLIAYTYCFVPIHVLLRVYRLTSSVVLHVCYQIEIKEIQEQFIQ